MGVTEHVLQNILSQLHKVKKTGIDRWIACCPVHADKSPSFSIKLENGKIVFNCFAGCSKESIVSALGIDFNDLFPSNNKALISGKPNTSRPKPPIFATEALEILREEAQIVMMGAYSIRNDTVTNADLMRLEKCMQLIHAVYEATGNSFVKDLSHG